MADAISLQSAGNVVSYLAPGYFAQWTYRRRFPSRTRPAGEVVVISTVLSLPFVALAKELVATGSEPTDLLFAVALLIPALLAGYFLALIRDSSGVRSLLAGLGFGEQPEASMWLRTLQYLPDDAWVTVSFKDGVQLAGVVRSFPGLPDDGVNELYILHPHWGRPDGSFDRGDGEGVIVRLEEVATITLSVDPLDS